MGSAESGLSGHLRGWNIGIQVSLDNNNEGDYASIYLTSGSNGSKGSRHLFMLHEADLDLPATVWDAVRAVIERARKKMVVEKIREEKKKAKRDACPTK